MCMFYDFSQNKSSFICQSGEFFFGEKVFALKKNQRKKIGLYPRYLKDEPYNFLYLPDAGLMATAPKTYQDALYHLPALREGSFGPARFITRRLMGFHLSGFYLDKELDRNINSSVLEDYRLGHINRMLYLARELNNNDNLICELEFTLPVGFEVVDFLEADNYSINVGKFFIARPEVIRQVWLDIFNYMGWEDRSWVDNYMAEYKIFYKFMVELNR